MRAFMSQFFRGTGTERVSRNAKDILPFFSGSYDLYRKSMDRKIRRDPGPDFVINKNTKVCSLHFTSDDYISGDAALHSARRVLKATAVPSVFPWTREVYQRKSKTSQLAASMHRDID